MVAMLCLDDKEIFMQQEDGLIATQQKQSFMRNRLIIFLKHLSSKCCLQL